MYKINYNKLQLLYIIIKEFLKLKYYVYYFTYYLYEIKFII